MTSPQAIQQLLDLSLGLDFPGPLLQRPGAQRGGRRGSKSGCFGDCPAVFAYLVGVALQDLPTLIEWDSVCHSQ